MSARATSRMKKSPRCGLFSQATDIVRQTVIGIKTVSGTTSKQFASQSIDFSTISCDQSKILSRPIVSSCLISLLFECPRSGLFRLFVHHCHRGPIPLPAFRGRGGRSDRKLSTATMSRYGEHQPNSKLGSQMENAEANRCDQVRVTPKLRLEKT